MYMSLLLHTVLPCILQALPSGKIKYILDILPFRNIPKHSLGFLNVRNSPGDQIRHSIIHYTLKLVCFTSALVRCHIV